MRGYEITNGVKISVDGRLMKADLSVTNTYYWEYDICVKNLRMMPITVINHCILCQATGQTIRERDYGLAPCVEPAINPGRSFSCTRVISTSTDHFLFSGFIRVNSCEKRFTAALPKISFQSTIRYSMREYS